MNPVVIQSSMMPGRGLVADGAQGDAGPPRPLVSVVIPAYNAARFVLEAIRSVYAQHYAPLEVLLVDDGSTDDTVAIVRREAPEVRIIQQANGGVAAARNTGLRHATGQLICLLDADDGWYPGKLHSQVRHLQQHPELGAVYHAWHVWLPDSEGVFQPMQAPAAQDLVVVDPDKSGWIYLSLLMDCIVHTSTIMMRREFVDRVGLFRTDLINGEDYDYWLRLSRLTQIDKLAAVYSFYRGSPGSLTSSVKPVNYEYNVVCSALERWGRVAPNGKELPQSQVNRRMGKLAFDFAYGHFRQGSARLARSACLQSFRHDPWRWKALVYFIASFRQGS